MKACISCGAKATMVIELQIRRLGFELVGEQQKPASKYTYESFSPGESSVYLCQRCFFILY